MDAMLGFPWMGGGVTRKGCPSMAGLGHGAFYISMSESQCRVQRGLHYKSTHTETKKRPNGQMETIIASHSVHQPANRLLKAKAQRVNQFNAMHSLPNVNRFSVALI